MDLKILFFYPMRETIFIFLFLFWKSLKESTKIFLVKEPRQVLKN